MAMTIIERTARHKEIEMEIHFRYFRTTFSIDGLPSTHHHKLNIPNATKYIDTITGQVVYKSLSNCCEALHEFNCSYALRIVSPGVIRPVGMHRCKIGVLENRLEKINVN